MLHTIFLPFLITTVFAFNSQIGNTLIPTGTFSPNTNYNQDCHSYFDCFNCTIANCHWRVGTCQNNANRDQTMMPKFDEFFRNALRCEDDLNVCQASKQKNNMELHNLISQDKARYPVRQNIDLYNYTFAYKQNKEVNEIPPNYFCL